MADDRPETLPHIEPAAQEPEAAAEWERQSDASPMETDAWIDENIDWVRARIQEALDDPRPPTPLNVAFDRVEGRLRAKYGSGGEGA